ncbi:membrane protein, partial [Pantoea ananatis]
MNIKNFLFLVVLVPWAANAGTMSAIFSDTITNIFIFINIVLTIFFAFIRFDRFSVVHGPEVLTTIGILGCFVGIASSLLHFDASNVSESVPHLLEGVKTAFLASLSGVFGSLVIRARHYFQKKPIQQSSGAPKAATLDDVVSATQELQRSLSGNAEGSLLSQLKLIRQEQSDELLALRKSFESFSEKMAKDSSETLIEALKGVIKDFNEKIGEQFGENFKHLNAGVEKLVVWQQQYKEELDKLQILQKSSADDLNNASAGLALFIDRASNFADTAEALEITLKGLAYQHEQIENSQASLTEVLLQMKGVIPQFSQKIDEMADSMSKGVAKVQNEINEIMKGF